MADDLDLDLDSGQEINRTETRINKLTSEREAAKTAASEAAAKAEAAEAARIAAEKERDFFKQFTGVASKFPGAAEYQDQILEKVKAGYTVDDAAVSVLNAEGKLTASPQPQAPAAGGSATNSSMEKPNKSVGEMTREEKRAALVDAEKRGDIYL